MSAAVENARPKRERAVVSYLEPKLGDIFHPAQSDDDEPRHSSKRSKRERSAVADEDDGRERRRSGRVIVKEAPIDAIAGTNLTVCGFPELKYSVGGADIGGSEASSILGEVETDEGLMQLHSQFRSCRRAVLWSKGKMVAAAVIELHEREKVLEIPILATKPELRQHGFGSVSP